MSQHHNGSRLGGWLRSYKLGLHWLVMLVAAAIVTSFGFAKASGEYLDNEETRFFYEKLFGPALNFGCGGELTEFKHGPLAQEFLSGGSVETQALCDEVKASENSNIWIPFYHQSAYMFYSAGWTWRVVGPSWNALSWMAGMVGGLIALSIILAGRSLGGSWLLGIGMSAYAVHTPFFASYAPALRDFSKAGFILFPIALLATAFCMKSRRHALSIFLFAGLFTGIGIGFRPDAMLVFPVAVIAALCLLPYYKKQWSVPLLSLIAFFVACQLALLPGRLLLSDEVERGSLTGHFFSLGSGDDIYEANLKMGDAAYSTLNYYGDELVFSRSNLISLRDGKGSEFESQTPLYDDMTYDLFFSHIMATPADMFARPFFGLAVVFSKLPEWLAYSGLLIALGMLLALISKPAQGTYLFLTFMGCMLVASLQFIERHYFYLDFFGYFYLLLLAGTILSYANERLAKRGTVFPEWILMRNQSSHGIWSISAVTIFVLILSLPPVIYSLLQIKQNAALGDTFNAYRSSPWQPLDFSVSNGRFIISKDEQVNALVKADFSFKADRVENVDASLINPSSPADIHYDDAGRLNVDWSEIYGYQMLIGPYSADQFPSGNVVISIQSTSLPEKLYVGLLTADRTRWLVSSQLVNAKSGMQRLVLTLPDLSEDFVVTFAETPVKALPTQFEVLNIADYSEIPCGVQDFVVKPIYTFPNVREYGWYEAIDEALSPSYVVLSAQWREFGLTGFEVDDVLSQCLTTISTAPFPKDVTSLDLSYDEKGLVGSRHRATMLDAYGRIFLRPSP